MIIKKGFTLIELVLVIAVLGVLATFTIVRFIGPQRQARDNQRMSDLRQYQTAVEVYASQNQNKYPVHDGDITALCTDVDVSGCPNDPDPAGDPYKYQSDASGTRYVMWAHLAKSDEYFIICSTGESGKKPLTQAFNNGNCPANL